MSLLTTKEIADTIEVSTKTVYSLIAKGLLVPVPKAQTGRNYLFRRSAVRNLMASCFMGVDVPTPTGKLPQDFMTSSAVAEMMGKSISTVSRMCDRGMIPYYKFGRKCIRFRRAEVEEALA